MRVPNFRLAALALTSGLLLSGCAYGGMYGDYGYGGVGVGVGYGDYGYGYPYGGYGYGYGYPYQGYGWYGDYYYPGSGYYVYDRHRQPRVWTDRERQFWTGIWKRTHNGTTSTGTATTSSVAPAANWSGFDRHRNRGSDVTTSSSHSDRGYWRQRSSSTTTSSSDTTSTTRSDRSQGRGHSRQRD
jgi:hypothetical protein